MLHACRFTRLRAGHIWPSCSAGFLTYPKVHSHVIFCLSTSKHAAFFRRVANLRFRDPSAGHQLLDCTYRRRRCYHDARRHRTDWNVGNDQVVPKRRPGWTTYGALLLRYLLLLPLEAELSISRALLPFTWHHIALPSVLFCPSPHHTAVTQSHLTTVRAFLFVLRSLRAWNTLAVGSVISGDISFSARRWPLPDDEAGTTAMCFYSPLSSNTNFQERTPRSGAKPATETLDHQPVIRSTHCTLAQHNGK
jgi:hypothetical protein